MCHKCKARFDFVCGMPGLVWSDLVGIVAWFWALGGLIV